jgi:hypothetical protein
MTRLPLQSGLGCGCADEIKELRRNKIYSHSAAAVWQSINQEGMHSITKD